MSIIEHRLPDDTALAGALADDVARRLQDAISARGHALLCVSGGRSPVPFFDALSGHALDWARVTVTLVDERCVPRAHPDSNAGLVHQHLLTGLAAAASWIDLVDEAGGDADAQASRAAARVRPLWPADVVVLGMGTDGHTASIFPGVDGFDALTGADNDALYAAVTPLDAPHQRITLTLRALRQARHRALQLSGDDKLAVYAQARTGADPARPISLVLAGAPTEVWIAG
ncbi:MAG: 6-phosphogluconolactonase [Burkholderiaceae bacterium]